MYIISYKYGIFDDVPYSPPNNLFCLSANPKRLLLRGKIRIRPHFVCSSILFYQLFVVGFHDLFEYKLGEFLVMIFDVVHDAVEVACAVVADIIDHFCSRTLDAAS